jgi:predicted DNA binding CopG/RHH family protein
MATLDAYETEVLSAYDAGKLPAVGTKAEMARLRAAARATAVKDRRVNIRISSGDLQGLQVKALEQGLPYQTLVASILHQYVTGRLQERTEGAAVAAPQPKRSVRRVSRREG